MYTSIKPRDALLHAHMYKEGCPRTCVLLHSVKQRSSAVQAVSCCMYIQTDVTKGLPTKLLPS